MWNETARLDTVSPAGQMEAAEDDVLPAVPELNMPERHVKKYVYTFSPRCSSVSTNGLRKCRGDIVSYQNYVLSRMPEVWGEDAATFNPYRWFNDIGEPVSYSPFSTQNKEFPSTLLLSCSK